MNIQKKQYSKETIFKRNNIQKKQYSKETNKPVSLKIMSDDVN